MEAACPICGWPSVSPQVAPCAEHFAALATRALANHVESDWRPVLTGAGIKADGGDWWELLVACGICGTVVHASFKKEHMMWTHERARLDQTVQSPYAGL